MRTRLVRYGAGAVLAALAAGLLVSSGVAHAALGGSGNVSPRGGNSGVTGCVFPASVRARGEMINAGECAGTPGSPGRAAETYPVGRPGPAVLDPRGRACLGNHPERRGLACGCPVAAVIGLP